MRIFLIIIGLIIISGISSAQTATPTPSPTSTPPGVPNYTCGSGLPCGPIPWQLPAFRALVTPTRFPTVVVSRTPTATPLPGGGITPTAYVASPTFEFGSFQDQISTLQALLDVEVTAEVPIDLGALGEDAGEMFGIVKGIEGLHLGIFTPIITVIFAGLFLRLGYVALGILLPLITAIFGLLRRLIQFVLDFIPG